MSWEIPDLGPLIDVPDLPVWNEISTVGGEPMYWGRDGQPMTLRQWLTGCKSEEYRILGRTKVGDVTVVTAWLGVDTGLPFNEKQVQMYGTIEMRHGSALKDGEAYSNEVNTSSEDEAKAEHERRVTALRAAARRSNTKRPRR